MALLCYNRGCGQRFDPETNSDGKRNAPPAFPPVSTSPGGTPLAQGRSRGPPASRCRAAPVRVPSGRPLSPTACARGRSATASDPLPAATRTHGPTFPAPTCLPVVRSLADSGAVWNIFIPPPPPVSLGKPKLTRCYRARLAVGVCVCVCVPEMGGRVGLWASYFI